MLPESRWYGLIRTLKSSVVTTDGILRKHDLFSDTKSSPNFWVETGCGKSFQWLGNSVSKTSNIARSGTGEK